MSPTAGLGHPHGAGRPKANASPSPHGAHRRPPLYRRPRNADTDDDGGQRWFEAEIPAEFSDEENTKPHIALQRWLGWSRNGVIYGHDRHHRAFAVDASSGRVVYLTQLRSLPHAWRPDGAVLARAVRVALDQIDAASVGDKSAFALLIELAQRLGSVGGEAERMRALFDRVRELAATAQGDERMWRLGRVCSAQIECGDREQTIVSSSHAGTEYITTSSSS